MSETDYTARSVLTEAGYSAEDIDAGMAYADKIGWDDEDDRGALAMARILYDDAKLARSPRAPWEPLSLMLIPCSGRFTVRQRPR